MFNTLRRRISTNTGRACIAALATIVVLTMSATAPVAAHSASSAQSLHSSGGGPLPPSTVKSVVTDKQGTHVTYASGIRVTDGSEISGLPTPAVTGTQSLDYLAYVKNGHQPIVMPAYDMVLSTSGVTTEVTPPVTEANCSALPTTFDITTASDTDLAKYGFPSLPETKLTRAQYNQKFGWMKHRVCTSMGSNGPIHGATFTTSVNQNTRAYSASSAAHFARTVYAINTATWAGNVADQDVCSGSYNGNTGMGCPPWTPNYYYEADMDFNVPCATGSSPLNSSESAWIGLGGATGGDTLIQTGSETAQTVGIPYNDTWIEYVTNNIPSETESPEFINISGNSANNSNGHINCGTHIYTRVWDGNDYEIGNIATGYYYQVTNHGPTTAGASAEAISEDNNTQFGALINYGWVTFKGIGTTVYNSGCSSGCYESFVTAEHDYTNNYQGSTELQYVGPLVHDGSDVPYDDNTISFVDSCGGVCP